MMVEERSSQKRVEQVLQEKERQLEAERLEVVQGEGGLLAALASGLLRRGWPVMVSEMLAQSARPRGRCWVQRLMRPQ
jgi:hypothetical protein